MQETENKKWETSKKYKKDLQRLNDLCQAHVQIIPN